jgi:hypothetical protein
MDVYAVSSVVNRIRAVLPFASSGLCFSLRRPVSLLSPPSNSICAGRAAMLPFRRHSVSSYQRFDQCPPIRSLSLSPRFLPISANAVPPFPTRFLCDLCCYENIGIILVFASIKSILFPRLFLHSLILLCPFLI